ncbi:MAG: dihydrolipoamide acyltransferase [Ruminococcus sp.]|nr:dihydrolipoamide acyltransferase [Ruminococcus sp.]
MKPITISSLGTAETTVDEGKLAKTVKSGSLPVFATPMMVALMEEAACDAMTPFLEEDETTVGTKLELYHQAAMPCGMTVRATAEITGVCGREIIFHITARDDAREIGSCNHHRFLVQSECFLSKAEARRPQEERL